jgi:hypothetical protein
MKTASVFDNDFRAAHQSHRRFQEDAPWGFWTAVAMAAGITIATALFCLLLPL